MFRIYVPYFGTDFSWLLKIWLDYWKANCLNHELVVFVCDDARPIPREDVALIMSHERTLVKSVPHSQLKPFIRTRTEAVEKMDTKEALALWSLKMASVYFPTLVMDLDAFITQDPEYLISKCKGDFGMVRDPMLRTAMGNAIEHNAGVLYFSGRANKLIATEFERAWIDMQGACQPQSVLLGQKAWSLTHFRLANRGAFMLPDEMNWSRCWGPNSNAFIKHYHGPTGKQAILGALAAKRHL